VRYQLHSVEGCGKCPTVPQRSERVTGTRAAGQGTKSVSKVIRLGVQNFSEIILRG